MHYEGRQAARGQRRLRRPGTAGLAHSHRGVHQRQPLEGVLHERKSAGLGADRDECAAVHALSAKKTEAPRKSGGSPTALEECACGVRLQGASASSVTRRSSGMSFAVGILYVPAMHCPLTACLQASAHPASLPHAGSPLQHQSICFSRTTSLLAHLAHAHLGRGCAGRLVGATCGPHPPRPAPPGRSSPFPARSRPPPACTSCILTDRSCPELSRSKDHAWRGSDLPGQIICCTTVVPPGRPVTGLDTSTCRSLQEL